MAISRILRDERITSVLIGASRFQKVKENVSALDFASFIMEELTAIETILDGYYIR